MDHQTLLSLEAAERGPTPEELARAPRLDGWWLQLDPNIDHLRACGDVSDHPTIAEPFVTTSPVLAVDTGAGWLRTLSRFYRLGPALDLPGMTIPGAVSLEAAQRFLAALRAELRRAAPRMH